MLLFFFQFRRLFDCFGSVIARTSFIYITSSVTFVTTSQAGGGGGGGRGGGLCNTTRSIPRTLRKVPGYARGSMDSSILLCAVNTSMYVYWWLGSYYLFCPIVCRTTYSKYLYIDFLLLGTRKIKLKEHSFIASLAAAGNVGEGYKNWAFAATRNGSYSTPHPHPHTHTHTPLWGAVCKIIHKFILYL